jgi:hypothetical protein
MRRTANKQLVKPDGKTVCGNGDNRQYRHHHRCQEQKTTQFFGLPGFVVYFTVHYASLIHELWNAVTFSI